MTAGVAEFRRRLAETSDGGRKLRALAELLAPYRWRVIADVPVAAGGDGRGAGAGAAGQGGDQPRASTSTTRPRCT